MDNLDQIYKHKFGNTEEVTSLGWGSTTSQEDRFLMLMDINRFDVSNSVLDIGCGHGDLSKYISNCYTGVDLRKYAIDVAIAKYPNAKFIHGSIDNITESYDWVFASGIFCFKSDNWHNETIDIVSKMYDIAIKGVAINFLSNLSKGNRDADMMYASMEDILQIIKNVTNKFTIRHDYRPNDCTVYLYK